MIWGFIAVPLFLALLALSFYMNLLSGMFQFAFGCSHDRLSRVFTIKKRTYKVCYECGHEFDYSWPLMHTLRPALAHATPPSLVIARQAEVLFI